MKKQKYGIQKNYKIYNTICTKFEHKIIHHHKKVIGTKTKILMSTAA